jgi:hypothetical protein
LQIEIGSDVEGGFTKNCFMTTCCLPRSGTKEKSLIIELAALIRAKRAQIAGYQQHDRDELLEAQRIGAGNEGTREAALLHVKNAREWRKTAATEQEKLMKLEALYRAIEQSRRNNYDVRLLGEATEAIGGGSAVSVEEARAVMDAMAEQMYAVDQVSEELATAPQAVAPDFLIDEELNALFQKQHSPVPPPPRLTSLEEAKVPLLSNGGGGGKSLLLQSPE